MTPSHHTAIDLSGQPAQGSLNITDPKQVDFWTRQFGVSELELRRAVADAGTAVADVRDYLGAARDSAG